eukprot:TRINITY_DN8902_c0_g1_i1.p1 TRINITY_DN8902_c0_g1~~TRINITY_DN8902_c0_g1_i1.p1  ORF type:complete len:1255 (+),score=606.97 TRINITY_DN8902_c0_g1_i1:98-3862(+)
MVAKVATHLLEPSTAQSTLATVFHIKWTMETCGQAFSLPIEEELTINMVVELYRRWALEPANRPPCFEEDYQHFIQEILKHSSMLFAPRQLQPLILEKHVALCSKMLDIYSNIGRQLARTLTLETWEVFLKILIGICDCLLQQAINEDALGRKLCQQLLKVIFDLWLHSRTRNPAMWAALRKFIPNWNKLMQLIKQWEVTTLGLTQRALILLYGREEAKEPAIVLDDTILGLEEDYVYYAWYRMLTILGNPNKLSVPANFLEAFVGIEKMVQLWLNVGRENKKRVSPPDGNTVLHIYGQWLFEAMQLDRLGFEEGTALAVKIMCNIVCTRNRSKYLAVYLSSFYSSMTDILQKESRVLISAIIHCQSLFDYEIEGLRVLVPPFIYSTGKLLTKKISTFDAPDRPEDVRRACIKILSTLVCLPNHFGSCNFTVRAKDLGKVKNSDSHLNTALDVDCYSQLKSFICQILLEALRLETHPLNIQMLLYLTYTYQTEDIHNSSDFSRDSLLLVVKQATTPGFWPFEVTLTAIKVISLMHTLYPKLDNANKWASQVVQSLFKFISYQSENKEPTDKEHEALVSEAFYCMANWALLPTQWIVSDKDTLHKMLEAIVIGLTGPSKSSTQAAAPVPVQKRTDKKAEQPVPVKKDIKQSQKIKDVADHVLMNLMNMLGNYPMPNGPSRASTLVTEEDMLIDVVSKAGEEAGTIQDIKQFIRYYSIDNSIILTIIERAYEEGGPNITIIIRDKTGKYAWDTKASYLPLPQQNSGPLIPPDENDRSVCCEPYKIPLDEVDPATLIDLNTFLDKNKKTNIVTLTPNFITKELTSLTTKQFGLAHDIAISPPMPANIYVGECKLQQSRLMLSHLGYFLIENRGRICLINQQPQFFQRLSQIDQTNERECFKIGVLFVAKSQTQETEYLANMGGTIDYQEFISQLGWGINVATHTGYLGGIDKKSADYLPYYSTYNTEIIFHVATLMHSSASANDEASKQKKLSAVYVVIVWAEDGDAYKPNFKSMLNHVHIVISPLQCGLYRIRVHARSEKIFGPLFDDMIVSKHILGPLVRETAISAHRAVTNSSDDGYNQLTRRKALLAGLIEHFRLDTPLDNFFASVFTALPITQVGPTVNFSIEPASRPRTVNTAFTQSRITPTATRSQGRGILGQTRAKVQQSGSEDQITLAAPLTPTSTATLTTMKIDGNESRQAISSGSTIGSSSGSAIVTPISGPPSRPAPPPPKAQSKTNETENEPRIRMGRVPINKK